MALKEDYKDAVFAGLRKYKMLDNGDGTVSPVDMTEYENGGDKFGAKDVNAITKTVNATGEIIADDNDGFKPDQKYVIGDIVIYDNKTWRFKVDHEPGEWDESQVERTNILAVIAEQNKNFETLKKEIQNVITEPDYANKVDLKTYTSADNYYEVTQKGFLWVATGYLAYGVPLSINDVSGTASLIPNRDNTLYYSSALANQSDICTLPVSIGMKLYVTGGNAGYVWFVPYK